MKAGVILRKWAGMEFDVIAIKKVVVHVGGSVGMAWELGIGGDVDTTENDLAAIRVSKLAILYDQTQRRHYYKQYFRLGVPG